MDKTENQIDFENLLREACWLGLYKQLTVQDLIHWLASESDKAFVVEFKT